MVIVDRKFTRELRFIISVSTCSFPEKYRKGKKEAVMAISPLL
jgi:hypothetical protein